MGTGSVPLGFDSAGDSSDSALLASPIVSSDTAAQCGRHGIVSFEV